MTNSVQPQEAFMISTPTLFWVLSFFVQHGLASILKFFPWPETTIERRWLVSHLSGRSVNLRPKRDRSVTIPE